MIWRVSIKKEGWTDTVLVEAPDIAEASVKVMKEYKGHQITGIYEDSAIAIING